MKTSWQRWKKTATGMTGPKRQKRYRQVWALPKEGNHIQHWYCVSGFPAYQIPRFARNDKKEKRYREGAVLSAVKQPVLISNRTCWEERPSLCNTVQQREWLYSKMTFPCHPEVRGICCYG